MGIEGVGQAKIIPIEWLRALAGTKAKDSPPAASDAGAASPAPTDPSKLLEDYNRETSQLPEVRQDKIDEARLRISTGYYNRPEVKREILRSVLREFLPPTDPPGPDDASR